VAIAWERSGDALVAVLIPTLILSNFIVLGGSHSGAVELWLVVFFCVSVILWTAVVYHSSTRRVCFSGRDVSSRSEAEGGGNGR
jgi:hypothetical protein